MTNNNRVIEWAVQNRQVVFLLVAALFVGGIVSLVRMPKQEMPEYIIRKGLVVGVYPGATAEEVEEQLTRPLERFLFTFPEVNRRTTVSQTRDGVCYVFVDLADEVIDNNVVWSKIRHGIEDFKPLLPAGVLAVAVNDNFGDVSSVLITMESDDKTYREIDAYCDALEDRLRAVPDVANVRRYGSQREQIGIYVDNEKLSAYGIEIQTLAAAFQMKGFLYAGGSLESAEGGIMPVHIAESGRTEQEIAGQIVFSDQQGNVVRVKDVGRVVREYPAPDSYITHNGRRCVLLSVEVHPEANIITFGREVNRVLAGFKGELPASVNINRIADQPDIVSTSIATFLRELLIAILAVVLVIIVLLPFRVSAVSAMSIPITIAITFAVMYTLNIPLNFVTLAALMAVLGIIVDDTIVVVDNYIDKLDAGLDRRTATIHSVQEYFRSILSATLAITITFVPMLFTTKGYMHDMMIHFPWTVCIALFSSLLVGVLVIPVIQYFLIRKGLHSPGSGGSGGRRPEKRRSFLETVQSAYGKLLENVFAFPKTTLLLVLASIPAGSLFFLRVPIRMMPVAERNQFAVEIYLPEGSPLEKTASVADSMERILQQDSRVKSVSAFIGAGSPRFHFLYTPHIPAPNYAQFIVNTASGRATETMLDEYTNRYAFHFPECYMRFRQLDFQATDAPFEVRLVSDRIGDLKTQAEQLEQYLRGLDECLWVRTSFETPVQNIRIEPNPEEISRLGVNKALLSLGISMGLTGIKIGDVWEGDYSVPIRLKPQKAGKTISDLSNVPVTGLFGASVPLRQTGKITPEWNESVLTHRNGLRTLTVMADIKRGENVNAALKKIIRHINRETLPQLPSGMKLEYGGSIEQDSEVFTPILRGVLIAFLIIYLILVFHFGKLRQATTVLLSTILCTFGAGFGVWIMHIEFNAFALLGIVGLAGIIVRNGIIMFDYIEYLRYQKGETVRQAAIDGGKRRMRPVFLTSSVAAMGVLPMIISQSPMWAPMAAIMFFGTLITMFFILTVLPLIYYLLHKTSK